MKDIYNKNLGKETDYKNEYNPSLLDPIHRSHGRKDIGIFENIPFKGFDLWTSFEMSWLNKNGKPIIAIAEFKIPCDSPYIIESKSFKLYLNSLNQSKFESVEELSLILKNDLSECVKADVIVDIFESCRSYPHKIIQSAGKCIDDLDIKINDYDFDASILVDSSSKVEIVSETLSSHLLKSNCLVTNQPDWGSVFVTYEGGKIDEEKLLRYLISFRLHNEFHEQCVERIFNDINRLCNPKRLSVFARYTRRGGLDINPFRSNFELTPDSNIGRLIRQ